MFSYCPLQHVTGTSFTVTARFLLCFVCLAVEKCEIKVAMMQKMDLTGLHKDEKVFSH